MLPAGFRGGLCIIYWLTHIQSVLQIKNEYCLWPSDTATSGMAVFISALSPRGFSQTWRHTEGNSTWLNLSLIYLDSLNAHSYVSTVFEIACIFHITGIRDNCVAYKRSFHICQLLLIPYKSTRYTFTGSSCLLCLLRLAMNHIRSRFKYHLIYLHESLILTGFDSNETSLFLILSWE